MASLAQEEDWTTEELLLTGSAFRKKIFDKINSTKLSIDISSYIFESDQFGNELLSLILKKIDQGIKVRILVDGFGSSKFLKSLRTNSMAKIVRVYHLLPWPFSKIRFFKFDWILNLIPILKEFNIRNHEKIIIFDSTSAIVGSRNFHDQGLRWRETSVYLEGSPICNLNQIFDNLWDRSHTLSHKRSSNIKLYSDHIKSRLILTNHLIKNRQMRNAEIISRLSQSTERIFITTPYFHPSRKISKVLIEKAMSGVNVMIVLPQVSDVPISKWIANLYYRKLFESGIKVYEYTGEILHAKTLIIDDWVLTGSSNFNQRSLLRDIELDVVLTKEKSKELILTQFHKDVACSIETLGRGRFNFLKMLIAGFLLRIGRSWF